MAEVRRLWIEGPAGRLEAALRVACPARATVVVAHPHPLHGGTLDHPVVFHAERRLHRAGIASLRFNFRGVGASEGRHDGGAGEVADVGAACSWIRGIAPGAPLILVGYSFGAWCALRHAAEDAAVGAVIAIGLPVRIYALDAVVGRLGKPLAVVQASRDEFGTARDVEDVLRSTRPRGELYVVEATSHLFPGRAREAAATVERAAARILASLEGH